MFGNESTSVIRGIWEAVPDHHIHAAADLPLDTTIPLLFHSDGVDIYRGTPFRVYQVASALAHNIDFEDGRSFSGAMDEHDCTTETDAAIAAYMEWNFKILESGVHPETDFEGNDWVGFRKDRANRQLMGGWRASWFAWTGAAKEKVYQHKFHRNYMSTFMCEKCLCSNMPDTVYGYDFSPGADLFFVCFVFRVFDFWESAMFKRCFQRGERAETFPIPTFRIPGMEDAPCVP